MATPIQALKQLQDYANGLAVAVPTLSTYLDAGVKFAMPRRSSCMQNKW